jgi:hypothetical protein
MKRFKSDENRSEAAENRFRRCRGMRRREFAMRPFPGYLMVGALLLAGYSAAPAVARDRPVLGETATPNLTPGTAPGASVSPLPPRPPVSQVAPPGVSEGRVGAGRNAGPVTGYGPGGMGRIPGSSPNRPY